MSELNGTLFGSADLNAIDLDDVSVRPGAIIKVGPHAGLQPIAPAGDEQIIRALLTGIIGENANREGLLETPKRVAKAWREMTKGYSQNPADILKAFEDGAEGTQSQWIIVKDIPIHSNCEHHLLPFFGTATIGYVPNGKVVGLSKLARLADVFAKRLQVQERLTNQIATALIEHADARCAMVSVSCRHMCMEARGIQREGATTSTLAYRTVAMDQESRDEYRREFFEQLKVA